MKIIYSVSLLLLAGCHGHAREVRASVTETFVLARTNLSGFGNPAYPADALRNATHDGLKFADLPSIGSGLAQAGDHEFWGITDRGPNGIVGKGKNARRTFPLPQFCPAIIRFHIANKQIQITRIIPLRDSRGKPVSGLSNLLGEERLFESGDAKAPLPLDESGVDPEAIRALPDGNFLVSEEYSPSIFVVSPEGKILVRYTPTSKPLTNATYPVKAILPEVLAKRRGNHGFESLAVSAKGDFAYAILQSPMGDEGKKRFANSRIIRAVKLDLRDPLDAKVVGEFLVQASAARDYSAKQKQEKISWSDADWIAPDQLVVVERGQGEAKLLLVDLSGATNILGRKDEGDLIFENTSTDLAALKIRPAIGREIISTRKLPAIDSDKIEGVAVLDATTIALTNDNDFGIGDNETGEPAKLWIVHLTSPLPVAR